ncbi:hypothetical protein PROAA_20009 [Candidatus Propionivibrio aalborgensis]|uniref:Uncharacterized protein n=1 Tax=Candidatus Propionivibrio aalborgensis TaxID=1860101 RepID=A0A1A8XNU1_9RHOO|nr:hypothetical protein PROAA_20009 [Candidatus Propionivibrio aalborgensis]
MAPEEGWVISDYHKVGCDSDAMGDFELKRDIDRSTAVDDTQFEQKLTGVRCLRILRAGP